MAEPEEESGIAPTGPEPEVLRALRDAAPSWIKDGGVRGPQVKPRRARSLRTTDAPRGSVVREPVQPKFPDEELSEAVTQVTATTSLNVSFLLRDATTTDGDPPVESNKVLVLDGRINGEFPSGMGFGNYILDLEDPAASIIYAGITFNPTTLAETSRFLGVWKPADGDFPESRVEDATNGFAYWPLGFTYFDADGAFQVWNQRLGDINFAFSYGVGNAGRPTLILVDSTTGTLDLDAIYPP